jgi:hypothetical protein
MSSFETHVRIGTAVHFALTTVSLLVLALGGPVIVVIATTISFPVTIAGATFPDIDHHASKPYHLAKRWMPRFGVGLLGVALAKEIDHLQNLVALFITAPQSRFYAGCLYILLLLGARVGVRQAFSICRPAHRTVTHAVSTGGIVSGFVAGCGVVLSQSIAMTQPPLIGSVWGLCFFAGVLSHLHCDGLVEVPRLQRCDEK